jgi:RecA/RadA recombinase
MFQGGIPSGRLVEVYGDSGSGKTQLALQLSANTALKQHYEVCYITTGDANPKRILEIMQSLVKVCNIIYSDFGKFDEQHELPSLGW